MTTAGPDGGIFTSSGCVSKISGLALSALEDALTATSENQQIYPAVQDICKNIFTSRLRRDLVYEETQTAINKSKDNYDREYLEKKKIEADFNLALNSLNITRRRRAVVVDKYRALSESKITAENKFYHEESVTKSYSEDAAKLCKWLPETADAFSTYRKEHEELLSKRSNEIIMLKRQVETERQRKREISDEKDRIKNQRKNEARKGIADGNSRRDDLQKNSDQFTSSNESDLQELSMLEEKLKRVQQANVQRPMELQAANLKEDEALLSLSTSLGATKAAIDCAEAEPDCGDEIQKLLEASDLIIEENTAVDMAESQEEIEKERKASAELKSVLQEEKLRGTFVETNFPRELSFFENRLKELDDAEAEELGTNNLEQCEVSLEERLEKAQDSMKVITEELGVIEYFVQLIEEQLEQSTGALQKSEIDMDEFTCCEATQKVELTKITTMKNELLRKEFENMHRADKIKKDIDYLEKSIKLSLTQKIDTLSKDFAEENKRIAEFQEREKRTSPIRDTIRTLEEDLTKIYEKLMEINSRNFDYQDEFKVLMAYKAEISETTVTHENQRRVKEEELINLKSKIEEAEKEEQELSTNFEEWEHEEKILTQQICESKTSRVSLQEKSEEACKLETLLIEKKSVMSQLQENKEEAKRRLDETKIMIEEEERTAKNQQEYLLDEKKKILEEIGPLEEERKRNHCLKEEFQVQHEKVLFKYDAISLGLSEPKKALAIMKTEKIKLLNTLHLKEKKAEEIETVLNRKIEAARAELDRLNTLSETDKNQEDKINALERQLAAFHARISEIETKRRTEKENAAAGLPRGPKPILKSQALSDSPDSLKSRKSVTFVDPLDNLQILQSDSSSTDPTKAAAFKKKEQQNCPAKKRKLLPITQVETGREEKHPKIASRRSSGSNKISDARKK